MKKMTGFCGLVCLECPAYKIARSGNPVQIRAAADKWEYYLGIKCAPDELSCDGCKSGSRAGAGHRAACAVRNCCIKNHLDSCKSCEDYMCDKLTEILQSQPDAKPVMNKTRTARRNAKNKTGKSMGKGHGGGTGHENTKSGKKRHR